MTLSYLLLDVFTQERLKGNPLAVVLESDGLSEGAMQAIAREFNLSETIFIRKPVDPGNSASVRIFTPLVELDFAGHPTVGATVVLGLRNGSAAVRIEENVGLINAVFAKRDERGGGARFDLPRLPARTAALDDVEAIARALGIGAEDVGCGRYQPGVYSAGTEFHIVPVRDAQVLRGIQRDAQAWPEAFPRNRQSVYVFTATPDESDNDFAARMFAPGMGLGEDPGTGAAASALIGLVAEQGDHGSGQFDFVLRQGHEMGRPCRITMQMRKEGGVLTHGAIGGDAVIVGEGVLHLG